MAGFNTAVTGIKATTTALDVAGNNIANASTVGFKATRAEFADIYSTQVVGAGSSNVAGSGVLISDLAQDFSSGTIEFTNSNLDLAINGSGFFQLKDGQGGTTYTRGGAFELDKDGYIVSKNGKNLQGYGLDPQGNQLPIQSLRVEEKESAPHATENIGLSLNLQPAEDISKKSDYYTKTNASSYAYTTTIETFDSLGNTQAIKFNYVEQKPNREFHQYEITTGSLAVAAEAPENYVSGVNTDATDKVLTLSGVSLSWESIANVDAAQALISEAAAMSPTVPVTLTEALTAINAGTAGAFTAGELAAANATLNTTAADPAEVTAAVAAAVNAAYAAADAGYALDAASVTALESADPRIDTSTVRYLPQVGTAPNITQIATLQYKFKSESTGQGEVYATVGTAGGTAEPLNLTNVDSQGRPTLVAANETMTIPFDPAMFTSGTNGEGLAAALEISIGGVVIPLAQFETMDGAGKLIVDQYQTAIKDKDPTIESVAYDQATNSLKITWKPEAGDVYDGTSRYAIDGDINAATSVFSDAAIETVEGDNSYLGSYRVYAYLNDDQLLNIGKQIDPGESTNSPALQNFVAGTGHSEPGPVMLKFSPTTGLLESINGVDVSDTDNVPKLTIRAADQANPNDLLLDGDLDSLRGVQFDISGTTRWESDSIVKEQTQDGYAKGDLIGVSFDEDGKMVAAYSNGQKKEIGIVAMATFESQAGLQPAGDTEWVPTLDSGQARLNPPGTGLNGSIRSGALEQSNVDLSAELVKLIEYQRNYQANSKTLETLNTVTQSILQI